MTSFPHDGGRAGDEGGVRSADLGVRPGRPSRAVPSPAASPLPFDPLRGPSSAIKGEGSRAIIRSAREQFGPRLALVSSFGAESAVLLHMAAQVDPAIPVIFLETGMLFGQTLDHRRRLTERLGLTDVRDIRPDPAELATNDPTNRLHRTDTDACCRVRKVAPLERALFGFDAWITGRKRFQGGARLRLPTVEFDAAGRTKINPLASWTKAELDGYAAGHDLPAHPLVAQGYPSVGCWPCTRPVDSAEDARAGRWAGLEKTECGIHAAPAPAAA